MLDLNERILDLVKVADIVFWPVALDVKYDAVERMPDGHIDITFFNGSIRNSEQEHMAKLLRAKSQTLIAFGSCAHEGCVPGLANLSDARSILEMVYLDNCNVSNDAAVIPHPETVVKEGTLRIPKFYDTVRTLDQTVDVDYYLPGCPPPTVLVINALEAIMRGNCLPRGPFLPPCQRCATSVRANGRTR